MHELDEDTAVTEMSPSVFRATITDRWNVASVPNGGYVMSVAVAAMQHALGGLDPMTVTAHFLRPSVPGPAEVRVERVRTGRRHSTARASLFQGSEEVLAVLGTLGDLGALSGDAPVHVEGRPPELPERSDALAIPRNQSDFSIARRFEILFAEETMRWRTGVRGERAEVRGWVRFADGREPDALSLVVFADALPPAVFAVVTPSWVPTLELTVHVRRRPAPGWLRARFSTRFLFGGYLEEDGEIWDESGNLVALSRQLALAPRR